MRHCFGHIAARLATSIILLFTEGQDMYAQQLAIPERWNYGSRKPKALFRPDTLNICFLGDIMMHSEQIVKAMKSDGTYDFSSYFSLIERHIRQADLAVANMEFTLGGPPYTGYPCFSAPDPLADYLTECGFDIFLTANNHIFDKGSEGAMRTLETYRRHGTETEIYVTGLAEDEAALESGFPLVIRRKGIKAAFINFTYGTNLGSTGHWPKTNYSGERTRIYNALKKADETADICIVLPHWGREYELKHSISQEESAEWLAANGADVIIGTHPHVIQDTCHLGKVPVAYSLGNAVSNMSAANTQAGLMATLKIVREGNGDIRILPLELTWLWCSRPGGYNNEYIVIPIEEYMEKEAEWHGKWDYEKMVTTYERLRRHL